MEIGLIRSRLWGARVPLPPGSGRTVPPPPELGRFGCLFSRLRANAPGSQSQINVNSWVRLSDAAPNDQTGGRALCVSPCATAHRRVPRSMANTVQPSPVGRDRLPPARSAADPRMLSATNGVPAGGGRVGGGHRQSAQLARTAAAVTDRWASKNFHIAVDARGPRASLNDPLEEPPDQA